MKILAVDVGGTNVKMLLSDQTSRRKFPSGATLTPERLVTGVKRLAGDWTWDAMTIGYPGRVRQGRIVADPYNLAPGWLGFDFERAFGCPVKLINDGAMQAYGSYRGGSLLFIGLGTGVGACVIVDGTIVPMEIGHLPYRKATIEYYLGRKGMNRLGRKKWQKHLHIAVGRLIETFHPDDVVIGGGNVQELTELPPGCREGHNAYAFEGGFRLWEDSAVPEARAARPEATADYH